MLLAHRIGPRLDVGQHFSVAIHPPGQYYLHDIIELDFRPQIIIRNVNQPLRGSRCGLVLSRMLESRSSEGLFGGTEELMPCNMGNILDIKTQNLIIPKSAFSSYYARNKFLIL